MDNFMTCERCNEHATVLYLLDISQQSTLTDKFTTHHKWCRKCVREFNSLVAQFSGNKKNAT